MVASPEAPDECPMLVSETPERDLLAETLPDLLPREFRVLVARASLNHDWKCLAWPRVVHPQPWLVVIVLHAECLEVGVCQGMIPGQVAALFPRGPLLICSQPFSEQVEVVIDVDLALHPLNGFDVGLDLKKVSEELKAVTVSEAPWPIALGN